MHIAVLADNIADRKQTERLLDRANSALASEIGTLYVDSFGDESSFLPVCMKYDLFLLDIDHDMAHCMEIVARLQELSAPGMIVVCKTLLSRIAEKMLSSISIHWINQS